MTDIMVDLETMAPTSRAAIVTIGAVEFSRERGLGRTFYTVVDLKSSMQFGGEVDGDTIHWWMQQSEDARREICRAGQDLPTALMEFVGYLQLAVHDSKSGPVCLWGNGATFDNVVLFNAYRACDIQPPWHFKNDRCYRTMCNEFREIPRERNAKAVRHNALDDAKGQAEHLLAIWKSLTPPV